MKENYTLLCILSIHKENIMNRETRDLIHTAQRPNINWTWVAVLTIMEAESFCYLNRFR